MVDAVVSYAVQKLGDFLLERVELRLSIRNNLEWLKTELQFMQSFLHDADQKQAVYSIVKQWVREIRDLAHETVDILDEFIISCDGEAPEHGIVDRLKRYACICSKEVDLYGIVNKIESLRERIVDLSRKRETYGITNINDAGEGTSSIGPPNRTNMRIWRRSTSYFEEKHFFGFKDVTEMLLKELVKDEDSRNVISIHGTGGLGKTTLAKKLYNSVDVQTRFACRAWVCVSQEYSIRDLLQTLVKSFRRCSKEDLEKLALMNEEDLERDLREFLNGKRYLVVVDDVWRKEAWESLKRAFPDGYNGSRVIITTRNKEVAKRVDDRSFIHHLRFLRPKESWDVFMNKISHRDGHAHRLSPAMQQMGEEMVEKCRGLPLAIVVLGGLLSHKKGIEQWRKVKDQLWQDMKNDSVDISHMLSLSYNDLFVELKQCFLYIGMFPEDCQIDAKKLMRLWMAEGFISEVNRMEDIAEDYLHELINRNLLQVYTEYLGKIHSCKIHDLLRDLAVEKAMEVNFFDIYNPQVKDGAHSCRRLTIHTQTETFFSDGVSSDKLRSLLFFNPYLECPDTGIPVITCQKLKFLCVLDLFNISFMDSSEGSPLPNAIGDLILLKYLGLRLNANFTQLPSTICKLIRLQTLVLSSKKIFGLPMEICNLINMRHLDVKNSRGQLNINTMRNLRTLRGLQYDQWMGIDRVNLVHLRELSISEVTPITGKPYSLEWVSNLKNLTTLKLSTPWDRDSYLPSLEPLFSCPCLLRLHLWGKIEKLPSINEFPQSLTNLILESSELSEDPMPTLEKLLNMRTLELSQNAYDGKEITCTDNGFLQLEDLILDDLPNLEKWILAETAVPVIGSLKITECSRLENVPERLKSIMREER